MRSTGALSASDVHFDFLVDDVAVDAPRLSGNLGSQAIDLKGGVTLASTDGGLTGHTEAAHFEGKEGARGVASGQLPIQLHGVPGGRDCTLSADRFRFDVAEQHATFEPARTRVSAQ